MSVPLTAPSLEELSKRKPRLYVIAEIIKNYYTSPTYIDITERVVSFGQYINESTLVKLNWEMPNLTLVAHNQDDYFHEGHSDSIWDSSPTKLPEECILRVTLYVFNGNTSEPITRYTGRVLRSDLQAGTQYATAEIVTVFEPADKLNNDCTVKSGSWAKIHIHNDDSETETRYSKGGICLQAPLKQGLGSFAYVGNEIDGDFIEYRHQQMHVCTLMHAERNTDDSDQRDTMLNRQQTAALIYTTPYQNIYFPDTGYPRNNYFYFYNPPAYLDYNASEIIEDLITTVAGVDSSFVDAASFGTVDTYMHAQTPDPDLFCGLLGKTFLEHVLEILSYAPECFLYNSYASIINMMTIPAYSGTPTPFVLSTKGSADNIIAIDSLGKCSERLVTDVEVIYHANTNKNWSHKHDITIGGLQDGQHVRNLPLYSAQDAVSPTPARTRKRSLEKPWFRASGSHRTKVANYLSNLLDVRGLPIDKYSVRATAPAFPVEIGDVVAVDEYRLHLDNKKLLVAGRGYDFDNREALLTLMDLEFT